MKLTITPNAMTIEEQITTIEASSREDFLTIESEAMANEAALNAVADTPIWTPTRAGAETVAAIHNVVRVLAAIGAEIASIHAEIARARLALEMVDIHAEDRARRYSQEHQ